VVLVILLIIAALPWGLPFQWRFVLPMLPYAAIHYWTVNRRGWMPAGIVFAAGLIIDIVTNGPLGFWSMIYLTGHLLAVWLSGPVSAGNAVSRWLGFVGVLAALSGLQWAAASVYFVAWLPWQPFVLAAAVTALFYPLLSVIMVRKPKENAAK